MNAENAFGIVFLGIIGIMLIVLLVIGVMILWDDLLYDPYDDGKTDYLVHQEPRHNDYNWFLSIFYWIGFYSKPDGKSKAQRRLEKWQSRHGR